MTVWLDGYMSKLDSDLKLDIKNLQLCRIVNSKYIKKISSIGYGMGNYDDKAKYETKDKSYRKVRRYLIIGLEEYNT